jgi:hypothetical protein
MTAIKDAIAPYQAFSQRQLSKRGESSMVFLQGMLFSIVSTMWLVGAIFAAKSDSKVFSPVFVEIILILPLSLG